MISGVRRSGTASSTALSVSRCPDSRSWNEGGLCLDEVWNGKTPALRPILRTVEDARDLNGVWLHLIGNDVRQRRESKFAPPGHAEAELSKVGKVLQATALLISRSGNAAGRFGSVPLDPFADVL